jgi:2-keto-4-pentenoate hydratase
MMPEDADAARAAVVDAFRGTRYLARMLEVLDSALRFEDPEFLCLLAAPDDSGAIDGLVLFGTVLGARLATKVHAVVAPDPRVQLALLDAVRETCVRSRERLVVCELPHDTPFDVAAVALVASGYREEGRIEDFVRDGVALRLLVWRPPSAPAA